MENMQELLEIYMEMTEKQDEIISKLTDSLKKATRELNHLKNLNEYFKEESNIKNKNR